MSITTETRRASYETIKPCKSQRHQQIVEAIIEHGPMTVDELMDRLGYSDPNRIRPRLTELAQAGALCTIGKRKSRRSGKLVAVWAVNEQKRTAPGDGSTEGGKRAEAHNHTAIISGKCEEINMPKKKIYTFRVSHPDFPTKTVIAQDVNEAIMKAAQAWGLGRDWPSVIEEAAPLRLGEVKP